LQNLSWEIRFRSDFPDGWCPRTSRTRRSRSGRSDKLSEPPNLPRSWKSGLGTGEARTHCLASFPEATYTIIDIQPAIDISRWYLTALFGPERLRFLSPAEAAILSDGSVDLAISISSLQEMRPDQVDTYLRLLDRVTEGGTVYLKQWSSWRNPDDGVELDFDAYPIPPRWEAILRRRSRVQTRFKEAAWAVPPSARGIVKPAQADAHKRQAPVGL